MHVLLGKDDQRVPCPDIFREAEGLFFIHKRRHPSVPDDLVIVSAVLYDLDDPLFSLRCSAYVDPGSTDAHDSCCPCTSPCIVCYHLRLVDHSHVVVLLQAEHLDGGGLMICSFYDKLFLPGDQRAGAFGAVHPFILFVGKKPQGSEVDAVICLYEILDRIVGLP